MAIEDDEIQRLVEEFNSELDASALVAHDITDGLKEIHSPEMEEKK